MALVALYDLWNRRLAKDTTEAMAAVADLMPAVVITGGSKGIGLALAKRFHLSGSRVLMIARSGDALQAARAEVAATSASKGAGGHAGPKVLTLAADVTAPDAFERIEETLAAHGCYLDILINNAGLGYSGTFRRQPLAEVDGLIDVNMRAVSRLTRLALPQLIERGRGGIINVASLGGLMPGPFQAQYYASKAYVLSLTRALAFETRGLGVRVCVVLPGPVGTDFHEDMAAENAFYRWVLPEKSPEAVAASTYRGYWLGHRTIIPGVLYSLVAKVVGVLPYGLLVPGVGMLLWPGRRRAEPETARARSGSETPASGPERRDP